MRKTVIAAMLLATAACAGTNAQPQPGPPPPSAAAGISTDIQPEHPERV